MDPGVIAALVAAAASVVVTGLHIASRIAAARDATLRDNERLHAQVERGKLSARLDAAEAAALVESRARVAGDELIDERRRATEDASRRAWAEMQRTLDSMRATVDSLALRNPADIAAEADTRARMRASIEDHERRIAKLEPR